MIGLKKLLNLAEQYYTSGLTGCAYLPLRAHAAISVAALVYRQIGIKTKNKGYPWFNGREFTSTSEKIICSFFGLLILYKRLFKKGQHKSILHDGLRGLPYVK